MARFRDARPRDPRADRSREERTPGGIGAGAPLRPPGPRRGFVPSDRGYPEPYEGSGGPGGYAGGQSPDRRHPGAGLYDAGEPRSERRFRSDVGEGPGRRSEPEDRLEDRPGAMYRWARGLDREGYLPTRGSGAERRFAPGHPTGGFPPPPAALRDVRDLRDHAGRGPKGWRRSDERIAEEIHERLTEDDRIDPRDVRVRISDGEIRLEGEIGSRPMKHRTEDLVASIAGVEEVDNRLRVRERGREKRP